MNPFRTVVILIISVTAVALTSEKQMLDGLAGQAFR